MHKKFFPILALVAAFAAEEASAQTDTDNTCWKRTSRACTGIVITEAGVHGALKPATRQVTVTYPADQNYPPYTYEERAMAFDASWDFGYLRKVGAKWHAGPIVLVGLGSDGARIALKGRVRRYVGERNSFEFNAGYLNGGNEGKSGGLTTDIRFNVQDMIALSIGYENIAWELPQPGLYTSNNYEAVTRASAVKVGAVLGSRPAALGTGVAAGLYVALIAALLAGGYD